MTQQTMGRPLRVGLISLGCAKNLVDAEIMLGTLLKDGVQITNETSGADVVIVNTCSFIDSAQEESVDTILESAAVREAKNRGQALIVSGCLPQRFRGELTNLFPEVDAFMGIDQVVQVTHIVKEAVARRADRLKQNAGAAGGGQQPETVGDPSLISDYATHHAAVATHHAARADSQSAKQQFAKLRYAAPSSLVEVNVRPNYIPDYETPRFRLTPGHFAYVKIAEGCNHPCSFCIIPRMRGPHRSRQQADIIAEARTLLAQGVKELDLISQDSTYYGMDLRPNHSRGIAAPDKFNAAVKSLPAEAPTICTLLRELNALPGDFWIRLLYTHPAHWTDELIGTIAQCPKVARYVDIPLQHIHPNMLERMRRETSQQYILDLLGRIRAGVPGIALRTTFIVGFPGETEACFRELLGFIREAKFERLGVFTYSQEEGTRAGKMAGQVPDRIKKQRRALAMAAQQEVAAQVAKSFVGRTMKVLIEKEANPRELKRARITADDSSVYPGSSDPADGQVAGRVLPVGGGLGVTHSSWEHGLIGSQDRRATPPLKGRYLVGRTEADAPDIDGRVYLRGQLPLSRFADVKIIGHTDYDLIGELANGYR